MFESFQKQELEDKPKSTTSENVWENVWVGGRVLSAMSLSQSVRVHKIISYANDVLTCVKLDFVTPSVLTSLRIIIH